jgi:serine/threonine protein kinase
MTMNESLNIGYLLNGKYRIDKVLGQGAYGIAYLATIPAIDLQVVVKEFFPSALVQRAKESAAVNVVIESQVKIYTTQMNLFLSEAKTLATCSQIDGVVHVTDYFSQNNTAYFVMRYIDGPSVDRTVTSSKGVKTSTVLKWAWGLLHSLGQVHNKNILHLDIKPENVIIDSRNGNPILIDFGISRSMASKNNHAINGGGFTPCFSAPEQQDRESTNIGPWTDIYGIGALLYYCISGERPVDSRERLAGRELEPLNKFAPGAPSLLIAAIERCLSLNVAHRPQSAEALLGMLAPLQPKDFHWLQGLPDNSFGKRIRGIHNKIENGASTPYQINIFAGIFQWFWLFSNRLVSEGVVLSLILATISGIAIWFHIYFILILTVFLIAATFCAFYGDYLLFNRLSLLGSGLTGSNENSRKKSGELLAAAGKPDPKFMLLGLIFPVIVLFTWQLIDDHEGWVRSEIAKLVKLTTLKEEIEVYQKNNGVAPASMNDIPNIGKDESLYLKDFKMEAGQIFITPKISTLPELPITIKQVSDGNGNIKWICEARNFENWYLPDECKNNQ